MPIRVQFAVVTGMAAFSLVGAYIAEKPGGIAGMIGGMIFVLALYQWKARRRRE